MKTGHWIETAEEYYKATNEKGGGVNENTPYFTDDIACSECLAKFSVIDNETERFICCPNCGAKMQEQELEQKPKSDWIPVSERLPEREGWYLVSLKNGNVQKAWYRVAPINQGGSYWRGSIKRPIAWMPLPEPYKAGRASDD